MLLFLAFTEMGKNINQDKVLNLKHYVEDYHKYVNSLYFLSDAKDHRRGRRRVRKRKGTSNYPDA